MKEFGLIHTYQIMPDGTVSVCLRPSDLIISDYISTWGNYASIEEAESVLASFISEMTPLLYRDFQSMDNVPESIRLNYSLSVN